ncbi:MAG: hypothetical protein WAN87_00805 [Thermoplasmata archaeon]
MVSGWRVIRARSLARRVLLGWLSAEWIGILIAYSVAIFAFTFLIGDVLVRLRPMNLYLLPVVLVVPIAAVFLVQRAARLPQELVRQARQPLNSTSYLPPSPSVRPSTAGTEWHSTGLFRRIETMFSVRQQGTTSSAIHGATDPRPDLLRVAVLPHDPRTAADCDSGLTSGYSDLRPTPIGVPRPSLARLADPSNPQPGSTAESANAPSTPGG